MTDKCLNTKFIKTITYIHIADWTTYFLQQPLNGNWGHCVLKRGSVSVTQMPCLENSDCPRNSDTYVINCGHFFFGRFKVKLSFQGRVDPTSSQTSSSETSSLWLPVHILCLSLQSRQQVWLVHCDDFLCVCVCVIFGIFTWDASGQALERANKLQCIFEILSDKRSCARGVWEFKQNSKFQKCTERVTGGCKKL